MNVMANFLKEHIPRDYLASVNEIMTVGGQCCTDLPEYAQVWYAFRATTREGIEHILDMLRRCGEAAALATGCEQRMRIVSGTRPWLPNHAMAELAFRNMELVGPPQLTEEDKAFARKLQEATGIEAMEEPFDLTLTHPNTQSARFYGGADDVNEFCWAAPTCWIHTTYKFLGSPRNFDLASWAPAALASTNVAHQCALTAAKTMALSSVELLTTPAELDKAQKEFRERTKDGIIPVAVPPDAKPPIEAKYSFPPFYPPDWRPPTG
jgi:aminobenzoyl-glutamate utilization protein B